MQLSPDELEAALLQLPSDLRARLAAVLLESLEEATEIDLAWAEEAERRAADVREGRVIPLPATDVLARIRAALH